LMYRPARLGIDSWAPLNVYKWFRSPISHYIVTLHVSQHRAGQTILTSQKKIIGGGLSWLLRLTYLAVGNDMEVDLF